ncbi:hypothetical protein [Aliiroseovarius sp. YM-037]|uniref:hypothetical protein n=1 Tax=Aliiroseovarius sp. YM-037 TaxID=3341728 RepID=UPI003A80A192
MQTRLFAAVGRDIFGKKWAVGGLSAAIPFAQPRGNYNCARHIAEVDGPNRLKSQTAYRNGAPPLNAGGKVYLIVQDVSFAYVRNVALFIHRMLRQTFGEVAELIVCPELDDATYSDGALIFVIGENFKRHQRRPRCRYVYLNFSVVEILGNPLSIGRAGWHMIRRKRAMLDEKSDLYDVLLDYYPPQTRVLARQWDMPVQGFDVAVHPKNLPATIPFPDRPFDVCFVGGMSERRRLVVDALKARGFTVSPHQDVVFEDAAAQSRCCLNIHSLRSNHLETPRIVGALAVGTPVVSEHSYGLGGLLPEDLRRSARLGRLADAVEGLLNDAEWAALLGRRSQKWYAETYLSKAEENWRKICRDVALIETSRPIHKTEPLALRT